MKGKLIIKILEKKSPKFTKSPMEDEDEEYSDGPEEMEHDEPQEESEETPEHKFDDKEVAEAQLRVGQEMLSGKDLVEFVDMYRDQLLEDKVINPFL